MALSMSHAAERDHGQVTVLRRLTSGARLCKSKQRCNEPRTHAVTVAMHACRLTGTSSRVIGSNCRGAIAGALRFEPPEAPSSLHPNARECGQLRTAISIEEAHVAIAVAPSCPPTPGPRCTSISILSTTTQPD